MKFNDWIANYVDVSPDEDLVVAPLEKEEGKKENPTDKHQMVFSITMEEWKVCFLLFTY